MRNVQKNELFELVQRDPTIFTFLREGSLDGMWYGDIQNPEHEWMDNRFWNLVALDNFHKNFEDSDHLYDQVVRYTHTDGGTVYGFRYISENPVRQ